jgi:hypothetical protein
MQRLATRIIASSFLFVSCTIAVFANGFSVGLFATPGVQANWNESAFPGYPPAFQSGVAMGATIEYRWQDGPYTDIRYYYHNYDASTITGFHLYRGYEGESFSLGAGWLFPSIPYRNITVTGGLRLEGAANFANYEDTELYFFYPELSLVPSIEITKSGSSPVGFGIELPVTLPFRRDVSTLSVGMTFIMTFYPEAIARAAKARREQ